MFQEAEIREIVYNVKYTTTEMTRGMDIQMYLMETENGPHQEENLSCPCVELHNLVTFFGTNRKHQDFSGSNHKPKFKFSKLPDAHHATQALLKNIVKDIGTQLGLTQPPSLKVGKKRPASSHSYTSSTEQQHNCKKVRPASGALHNVSA